MCVKCSLYSTVYVHMYCILFIRQSDVRVMKTLLCIYSYVHVDPLSRLEEQKGSKEKGGRDKTKG